MLCVTRSNVLARRGRCHRASSGVMPHRDEEVHVCSERLRVPGWSVAGTLLASLIRSLPTHLHTSRRPSLRSVACQPTSLDTCSCLLPSYVFDSSSPKRPKRGSGWGSGQAPDGSFRRLETATQTALSLCAPYTGPDPRRGLTD